ncbi:MAG: thioredoxin family protein [Thermodesulfobacteriota bacterium]
MRHLAAALALALTLAGLPAPPDARAQKAALPEAPAKGMVTMLDLGAKSCIPCKMMVPVMQALETQYAGKAAILFIDVWENPDQSKKYGLRAIPTQIFYDRNGKEVLRHEGFFDRESISAILDKLLEQE